MAVFLVWCNQSPHVEILGVSSSLERGSSIDDLLGGGGYKIHFIREKLFFFVFLFVFLGGGRSSPLLPKVNTTLFMGSELFTPPPPPHPTH